jgi:hypothetical protein
VSAPDDLALLPTDVAESANVDANGEVWWHTAHAGRAINALADAGLVILGLDMREYDDTGAFVEWAWSDYRPYGRDDVASARSAALAALDKPDRTGNAVLITWERRE